MGTCSRTSLSRCEGVGTSLVIYPAPIDSPFLIIIFCSHLAYQGIVTEFTVRTYPIDQVWGGVRFYSELEQEKLYDALHDFVGQDDYGEGYDTKAAIIVTSLITSGSTPSHGVFFFYDGPEPPKEGPFAAFLKIPYLIDTTRTQSYSSLVCWHLPPYCPTGYLLASINCIANLPFFSLRTVEKQWRPS